MAKTDYRSRRDPAQLQRGIPGSGIPLWYQLRRENLDVSDGILDIRAVIWNPAFNARLPVAAFRVGEFVPPENWWVQRGPLKIPAVWTWIDETRFEISFDPADGQHLLWIDAGIGALTSNRGLACAGILTRFEVFID